VRTFFTIIKGGSLRSPATAARVRRVCDPSRPVPAPMAPAWSARRGEYRVICLIDNGRVVVEIVAIVHRRDAYRSR
jgi:mRNA-degrading endonuclease RelE of RelBE toxin-antitoxin system